MQTVDAALTLSSDLEIRAANISKEIHYWQKRISDIEVQQKTNRWFRQLLKQRYGKEKRSILHLLYTNKKRLCHVFLKTWHSTRHNF